MGLDRPREPHHLTGAYGLHVVDLVTDDVASLILVEHAYPNIANFTRAFRRWTGQTPSAYRNGERSARR
jgi:AraC-like DNA-binding protein